MSDINILFYSNHCDASKYLISAMETEKLIKFFHLICTDNNPKLPPQITVTPTILIKGIPTPYIAGDAFVWLAKIKQWKTNMLLQQMCNAHKQHLQNINNNLVTDDSHLLGFNQNEMNGMSDIFSFFSKDMNNECQDALPQSFLPCEQIGQESIFTPPLEDGSYKTSKNKNRIDAKKQKELCTIALSERKKQDQLFKKNIDSFRNQIKN